MKTTLKSQSPLSAIFFWAFVIVAISVASFFKGWQVTAISAGFLVPASFAFRFYRTKYVFAENCLLIRDPLEKVEIPYTTIRGVDVVKANLVQRLIGFPKEVLNLKYNKFDNRFLVNASSEMLEKIQSNLSKAA